MSNNRPTKQQAEEAVKTLISWIGDDPSREGLIDTPKRVVKAYKEFFLGYNSNPEEILERTFEEVGGYDDIVLLKDMRLESHCEHHMVPFIGKAHIAYLPNKKVIGISKIARLLDIFAKRLQTQETLTAQIGKALDKALKPQGVIVFIEAEHQCMTTRGIHKVGTNTTTIFSTGAFKEKPELEDKFLKLIKA
ncbi:GTP cyclohydrolase I FolE [Rickettsiales bacterium]|nr:GTP cyclohydrolase I FolE [Rickettsiales bacterium]